MKYPQGKSSDPQNTREKKRGTHEILTQKYFGLTTHEKKFRTHEIPMRKNFGPTEYPRERNSNLRNTHEKKLWTHEIPAEVKRKCLKKFMRIK